LTQEHTFDAGKHRKNSLAAWLPDLLGRAAQSSPEAAPRRAKGAGLYGDGRGPSYPSAATTDSQIILAISHPPTHAPTKRGSMPVVRQTGFEEKMRAYLTAHAAKQIRVLTITTDLSAEAGRRRAAGGSPLRPPAPLIRTHNHRSARRFRLLYGL
jgi:hypothetical protein